MDKALKCVMCGCLISITMGGNFYCFAENYCKDCREKIEEQKHIIEWTTPVNIDRQMYITVSGTPSTTIASTNWLDEHNIYFRNLGGKI